MSDVTEACAYGKCKVECHISNLAISMSISWVISYMHMHVEGIINKAIIIIVVQCILKSAWVTAAHMHEHVAGIIH